MEINIKEIAKRMVDRGHTGDTVYNLSDDLTDWSNDLLDILESLYDIETEIRDEILNQDLED